MMNLQAMFPGGEWNETKSHFSVKEGQYWWPVAEDVDGEMVLTPRGLELQGVAPAAAAVLETAQTPPKRDMLTRKQPKGKAATVESDAIDNLDL